jgi:hypothetical protein
MKTHFLVRLVHQWWFWTVVLVLCGIGGLIWTGYRFGLPTKTDFTATVETRSLAFTIGDWPGSVGLFAQERLPVDLTIDSRCYLRRTSNGTAIEKKLTYRGQTFREVVLMSMDVSRGVRVEMDVVDGALVFNLERLPERGQAESKQEHLAPLRAEMMHNLPDMQPKIPAREQFELMPADDPNHLEFSIRFRAKPEAEVNVPLKPTSTVSFTREGVSQLLPASGMLLLRQPNRPRSGDFSISLENLKSGVLENLILQEKADNSAPDVLHRAGERHKPEISQAPLLDADFLSVRISGVTDHIYIQDVPGAARKNITRQVIPSFFTSARGQAIGAVLAIIATLFVFIFEERHRRWERQKR